MDGYIEDYPNGVVVPNVIAVVKPQVVKIEEKIVVLSIIGSLYPLKI